jgi:hypothetical protein
MFMINMWRMTQRYLCVGCRLERLHGRAAAVVTAVSGWSPLGGQVQYSFALAVPDWLVFSGWARASCL